jgi:hypothetical protein
VSDQTKRDQAYVLEHLDALSRRASALGMTTVLVYDQAVVDFFASEIEAAKAGYARFGREPFYVRVVAGPERRRTVASNFTR